MLLLLLLLLLCLMLLVFAAQCLLRACGDGASDAMQPLPTAGVALQVCAVAVGAPWGRSHALLQGPDGVDLWSHASGLQHIVSNRGITCMDRPAGSMPVYERAAGGDIRLQQRRTWNMHVSYPTTRRELDSTHNFGSLQWLKLQVKREIHN